MRTPENRASDMKYHYANREKRLEAMRLYKALNPSKIRKQERERRKVLKQLALERGTK